MPYKIRFMRKEDLLQVSQIDKEAFPTQWPPTNYRSELHNSLARYLVVYKEGVTVEPEPLPDKKGLFRLLRRFFGGKKNIDEPRPVDFIAGFVGGWIMADELHITEIAVRKTCQSQGIGQLMLISIIEIGEKIRARYATLEVRLSNVSAQKLYEEFGFEKVGARKAYYSDNKEDAVIMTTGNLTSPEFRDILTRIKQELAKRWGLSEVPGIQKPETVKR